MNHKIFSKIKAKYPLAALVILIVAALMGKPILEDETGTVPSAETTETAIYESDEPKESDELETTTVAETENEQVAEPESNISEEQPVISDYTFRSEDQYISHYEKHGIEMGFASAEEYLEAANKVISSPDALYKLEAEDNDHVYYLEETNEFVVVSQDGYIRTYFNPSAGIDYFNRQ